MNRPELLSPVGDFECLKAAVQNGADAVYLGASSFSARAYATNFDFDNLKKAIEYAHLRNVKVHLTLNILIKDNEFSEAIEVAKKAYEYGVDALIVQDLGLCDVLIHNFPNLPIHASTQMSICNLEGAKFAENFGFKRVVLSRELSAQEIRFIKQNSNIEIEAFIHGALCISYSGQCLFSSMVGGRSGNRGKCAQSCRLPYELLANSTTIDKGYLLSTKDLCSLNYLPELIDSKIDCFKIEGRMKSPEYVATVTRIYRKYIDLYLSNPTKYKIEKNDIHDLLQVFNRGNFSSGHLSSEANRDFIYKEKPNNMGIYIGNVSNYNSNKGHISLNLNDSISIGDTICFEHENSKYTVSELMIKNQNVITANSKQSVKIGRMKGNISCGDKIYKLSSKELSKQALQSYSNVENKKNYLIGNIIIKMHEPIKFAVSMQNNPDKTIVIESDIIPQPAINSPITEDRIIQQLSKTKNTPFEFSKINVTLDDNLCVTPISALNELRRKSITYFENEILNTYLTDRKPIKTIKYINSCISKRETNNSRSISLLLNNLNLEYDYCNLKNINRLYIPLKLFNQEIYHNLIKNLCNTFDVYIYMPTIIKTNYRNIINNEIEKAINNFNITGFVISNLSNITLLSKYFSAYDIISNYTFNVFNLNTCSTLNKIGINTITLSPELSRDDIKQILSNSNFNFELIVYGSTPLMTMKYCLLGKSNKCYPECSQKCLENKKYYLKDRLGIKFRIIPDNIQTITTVYNSKITSIDHSEFFVNSVRIDILDENLNEIQDIINKVYNSEKLSGKDYTNGNLNRLV